jgi:PucR C-terminal helix-turn-helix domain
MRTNNDSASLDKVYLIVSGLRLNRIVIEQAIDDRIRNSVPVPESSQDPEYEAGLRQAIAAIIDHSLDVLERGPEWSAAIPPAAAEQVRRAARVGVSLAAIQRRYLAGHRELGEFVAQEVERNGFSNNGEVLHHLRRTQEALLEYLAAAVECEYCQEQALIAGSHRSAIVRRLLAGKPVSPCDLAKLDYEIHTSYHLGLIVSGEESHEVVRMLTAHYGGELLHASLDGLRCLWFHVQPKLFTQAVEWFSAKKHGRLSLAAGEPGVGVDGFRLTHSQACDALAVALCKPGKVVWYGRNRLLTAALQNETLRKSLTQRYLAPLSTQSDGGVKLCRTLRTYIDTDCNKASTAKRLRMRRHTVETQLHTVERLVECPLLKCLSELDVALDLQEFSFE